MSPIPLKYVISHPLLYKKLPLAGARIALQLLFQIVLVQVMFWFLDMFKCLDQIHTLSQPIL